MTDIQENSVDVRLKRGTASDIPSYYANGFANALGAGDLVIVLERNGTPIANINLSYTVAKTLALSISQSIAHLESATGRPMLTTHEVERFLQEEPKH